MKKSYLISICCILFLLSLFIFQKINLTTADLGRHLMNGKLFLEAGKYNVSREAILHTNFFSYTNPFFPFVNHHWGSGILFYLLYSVFGFSILSLLYGFCILASVFVLFNLFRNRVPVFVSFPIMLLLIPFIGERTEVRPEGLSYLFISLIIAILYHHNKTENNKYLYFIPLISLIFVNTHIYFIFAPFIVGAFLFENLIHRNFTKLKNLLKVLGYTVLAICINPYTFYGVIYPFIVFKNYGYLIVENQSILFLTRLSISNPNFLWYYILTALFIVSTLFVFFKNKKKFPIALFCITLTFSILSFFAIRNISLYGIILIPLLLEYACILYTKTEDQDTQEKKENQIATSAGISIIIIIFILINFTDRMPWNTNWGIGLLPDINASAEFWKDKNLQGPIFSNYDIGGYLIFNLYPKEKVFVDNRPEAYPASFFQNEYIPMQNDDTVWQAESAKWNFNAIYFYRYDLTPWAQKFLISRVNDPSWAPIYVDNYTIIFLKRNTENAELIKTYELPKSMFNVK